MDQSPSDMVFRRLEVRSRRVVEEQLAGDYLSAFKGRGTEFDEVRVYTPGDEVRSIDWNVTARTGVPHTKRSIEERELVVWLLVDISASADFGSTGQSKREVAAELAAMLAWSATKANDRVGLILFTDEIELIVPPAKGSIQVSRILSEVLEFSARGRGTSVGVALEQLGRSARRHCVAIVISDFQTPDFSDELLGVAPLHDLIVLEIRDPIETRLPKSGMVRLRDSESGQLRLLDTSVAAVADAVTDRAKATRETRQALFEEFGVDGFSIQVDDDYGDELSAFLRARRGRKR